MAKEAIVTIRIDETMRDSAKVVCQKYGVTVSGAVRMFLAQVAREKRIPLNLADPIANPDEGNGAT